MTKLIEKFTLKPPFVKGEPIRKPDEKDVTREDLTVLFASELRREQYFQHQ